MIRATRVVIISHHHQAILSPALKMTYTRNLVVDLGRMLNNIHHKVDIVIVFHILGLPSPPHTTTILTFPSTLLMRQPWPKSDVKAAMADTGLVVVSHFSVNYSSYSPIFSLCNLSSITVTQSIYMFLIDVCFGLLYAKKFPSYSEPSALTLRRRSLSTAERVSKLSNHVDVHCGVPRL
jgi:hypothetical protein